MNNYDKIPIENIYYMLCYAKNRLKANAINKVSQQDYKNLYDLFGEILYNELSSLIKKGFYHEYIPIDDETSTLKGKINFDESLKKNTFMNGRAFCTFDEFTNDIIHNQIIKATLLLLIRYSDLRNENRENLKRIYKYFYYISNIKLDNRAFDKAKIHKNNYNYGFILEICKLIFDNLLINEKTGERSFKELIKDEKAMAYIFEEFVRGFYKKELEDVKVYRRIIKWNTFGEIDSYLPIMETDITLEQGESLAIIDTKYYKEPLAISYNKEKIRINNLYQIYAYVQNIEKYKYKKVVGALLYPLTDDELNLKYNIGGYDFYIFSVDLNKPWREIHNRLLEISNICLL